MGNDVTNKSRICPLAPGPWKEVSGYMKPRTIMAVGLMLMLTTAGLVYILLPRPPPIIIINEPLFDLYIPHEAIVIDGDANFSATALLEGWPGDGSPGNPFIIYGLEIDLGGAYGYCIGISSTRVNFIIRNCNVTGASFYTWALAGAGIRLFNVSNGELVNNVCSSNCEGIDLRDSHNNTVANNTCNDNYRANIFLGGSDSNTVTNNTCNGINSLGGIYLYESDSNTVTNNTCNYNTEESGIALNRSHFNTVANNTCNYNRIGIFIDDSFYNVVVNNTFLGNTEHNIVGVYITEEFDTPTPTPTPTIPPPDSPLWILITVGGGVAVAVVVLAIVLLRRR